MSPNHVIPADNGPLSPIAERVMKVESLTHDVSPDGIVIAVRSDLLVSSQALADSPKLREALEQIAEYRGSLAEVYASGRGERAPDASEAAREPVAGKRVDPDYELQADGPLSKVGLWRLEASRDAIDESRRLRRLVEDHDECVRHEAEHKLRLPPVSPNHVAILSPRAGGCPAAPPKPALARN